MAYTGRFKGRSNKTKQKKVSKREQLIKDRIEVLSLAILTERDTDKKKRSIDELNFLKQQLRYGKSYEY